MSEPVGIGFIGAGEISLLHAKAVKQIPGAKLVGLWNRTARAREGARRSGTAARGTRRQRSWSPILRSTQCSC